MTSFISFIITMILILNGQGGWAIAFFILGILTMPLWSGEE